MAEDFLVKGRNEPKLIRKIFLHFKVNYKIDRNIFSDVINPDTGSIHDIFSNPDSGGKC